MATRLMGNRYAVLASDGSHFADGPDVAFAFYNVGIQNNEFLGATFKKKDKQEKLKADNV